MKDAMINLVDEFFKRNLTEAEAQQLEQLLENSAQEALRFGQGLQREYLAMGLPVPNVPKNFGPAASKAGWTALKSVLVAAVLAGGASLYWWLWCPSPAPSLHPSGPQALSRPKAKLPPPPVEVPQRLSGTSVEGNRLSVVVELDHAAPVEVSIFNPQGRLIRQLYQGNLPSGKWSVHWDGLLADGSKASPGSYRIQVQSGSTQMSKTVAIAAGK